MRKLPSLAVALSLLIAGCEQGTPEPGADRVLPKSVARLELYPFEPVPGTPYVRAALREPAGGTVWSGYSASSNYAEAQNFLFYDLESGAARWLLAGRVARVVEAFPLSWPPRQTDAISSPRSIGEVRGFVYVVRERDTDGDGDVDRKDLASVAVSAPDGSGYRIIVPHTPRFLGAFWIDESRARILYFRDGKVHGTELDVARGEVVREVNAPGIPPG